MVAGLAGQRAVAVGMQGRIGEHTDRPVGTGAHQIDGGCRQVVATAVYVRTDHRYKGICLRMRLEEVCRGELRLVCNWIGPADLELDAKSRRSITSGQEDVRSWHVAQTPTHFG
jgi:hypothetical protein